MDSFKNKFTITLLIQNKEDIVGMLKRNFILNDAVSQIKTPGTHLSIQDLFNNIYPNYDKVKTSKISIEESRQRRYGCTPKKGSLYFKKTEGGVVVKS